MSDDSSGNESLLVKGGSSVKLWKVALKCRSERTALCGLLQHRLQVQILC